jgi:site-specific DNA-methyltransferase (adenine-specific)
MNVVPDRYLNQVINDDVMNVLRDLPDNCVDMIYGDPDYNVGINYSGRTYSQSWEAYVNWYIELARESLRVLRDDGNMYLINYPKQNAHLRVRFLDDNATTVNDYVWVYNTNVGHSRRKFTTAHRSILHATKSKKNRFYKEQVAQPYKNPTDARIKKLIAKGKKGRMPYSWLNYNLVKNVSRQKTSHPCQIPEKLSELLIKSCTQPGDTAFILFGGSGSEVVQAQNLGLNFLTCEIQLDYCDIIESRLKQGGAIDLHYRSPTQQKRINGYVVKSPETEPVVSGKQPRLMEKKARYSVK